ncbi:hypothetical protein OG21DRAFT_1273736 [Imleria badia]|nr:hypothetical protein OG21DRAFT_1273736 [Imleria badia]
MVAFSDPDLCSPVIPVITPGPRSLAEYLVEKGYAATPETRKRRSIPSPTNSWLGRNENREYLHPWEVLVAAPEQESRMRGRKQSFKGKHKML